MPPDTNEQPLAAMPPEIKPLSHAPINLQMSNDAKIVFDTIGKLAGLTVIYDPDFPARRIPVESDQSHAGTSARHRVDGEQGVLEAGYRKHYFCYSRSAAEAPRLRRAIVKTFYLSNTVQPQDLTEIVTGLRQLLDLKRIHQLNSQNAIIVRDTPDKLVLAEKMIEDIDKARPEVVVQVQVLQARTDRMRDLGILPVQSASLTVKPSGNAAATSGRH